MVGGGGGVIRTGEYCELKLKRRTCVISTTAVRMVFRPMNISVNM